MSTGISLVYLLFSVPSMQTYSETRSELSSLEDAYTNKAGISVSNNVTVSGVDSSQVSILGAGLNANANDSVSFNIGYTDESSKKAINTNLYTNVLQFDMNLSNAGRVSEDGNLAVPVEVTMPIPEGLSKDITLTILHFHHSDNGYDLIHPRFNSDGTISFTITHFSTFAFADTVSIGEEVSDSAGNKYTVSGTDSVEFTAPSSQKIKSISLGATVTIGNSEYKITSIGKKAFSGCKKLSKITIDKNVTEIKASAFKGCKKLSKITIKNPSISKIGKQAFKNISSKATVTIKTSSKKTYK
ncbi:MAG: leucine-rich repeat domain-containing protein, partial [Butyrivibrio sp.]|nr:leucine-rich repeat domain-containing protein [Butyrivibrio sp.]